MNAGEITAIVVGVLGLVAGIGSLISYAIKFGKDDGTEVARLDAVVKQLLEHVDTMKTLQRGLNDLEDRIHSTENQVIGQAVEKTAMKEMLMRFQIVMDRLEAAIVDLNRGAR